MEKKFTYKLAGTDLVVTTGKVAEQAGGACLLQYGDTVILATATGSKEPREGIDFFPLSVDYEEKMYSAGKIPGGFIKREGRPSEKAVLTSRLIDRPIRPLFPEGFRNAVQVITTVLSIDHDHSSEMVAMIGSSISLSIIRTVLLLSSNSMAVDIPANPPPTSTFSYVRIFINEFLNEGQKSIYVTCVTLYRSLPK